MDAHADADMKFLVLFFPLVDSLEITAQDSRRLRRNGDDDGGVPGGRGLLIADTRRSGTTYAKQGWGSLERGLELF